MYLPNLFHIWHTSSSKVVTRLSSASFPTDMSHRAASGMKSIFECKMPAFSTSEPDGTNTNCRDGIPIHATYSTVRYWSQVNEIRMDGRTMAGASRINAEGSLYTAHHACLLLLIRVSFCVMFVCR